MKYQGSCHCGLVSFTFESEVIEKGLRCNCSICIRKGILMSADLVAAEDLDVSASKNVLETYTFGSGIAKHHFCNQCGIYTFHESFRKPGHFRINLGCVAELDSLRLPYDIFDGAAL